MKLSAYAFNTYGSDARLYYGIHDMEQRIAALAAENAELQNERDKYIGATQCATRSAEIGGVK